MVYTVLYGGKGYLEGLISAGRQQPVAVGVPQSLHDSVAVPMQGGNVAPSLCIPHLYKSILAAAGYDSLGGVPVAAFDVATVSCHVTLSSACWEVPNLCCRHGVVYSQRIQLQLRLTDGQTGRRCVYICSCTHT